MDRCYDYCERGFGGEGPTCYANCPTFGYRDDGSYCYKTTPSYGRGAGSPTECYNCEKVGGLWYPICQDGFHSVGCCVCSEDCPNDFEDIGISCKKPTYNRGNGEALHCEPENEYDTGLCYPNCEHDATGEGPVCWGHCPTGTSACFGVLCITPD